MEPAHLITLFFLLISSIKDLRTRRGLKDKTYIIALILISGSFLIFSGPGTAGASIIQALLGLISGILMRIFFKLGGADVWTLALISASFPEKLIIQVIAYTFIPLVIWLKIYQLTGKEKAPAIPALTAGMILAITVL